MIDLNQLRHRIETAYESCGNTQGWRFLYSPPSVLQGADVAIIGLNPGGVEEVEGHGQFATEPDQSAYVHETWKKRDGTFYGTGEAPLQIQVRLLCRRLGVRPEQALTGNLMLWRSYAGKELRYPEAALQFGQKLWHDVLKTAQPSTIITIGIETGSFLATLLDMPTPKKVSIGWGNQTARHSTNGKKRLIALPHLSRYRIMDREKSKEGLDALFSM